MRFGQMHFLVIVAIAAVTAAHVLIVVNVYELYAKWSGMNFIKVIQ